MTPPIVYQTKTYKCNNVNFCNAQGSTPFVNIMYVPITVGAAGEVLHITGDFTLSARPDTGLSYPGFSPAYFSAGCLFLTATDPSNIVWIDFTTGQILDCPSGGDACYSATPTNPYREHRRNATYVTQTADIGNRWVVLVGWATSASPSQTSYLLNITNQCQLNVMRFT